MKKLLSILLLFSFVAPTVTCLCTPAETDVVMACVMDEPASCCCETEVQTAQSPQTLDYVAPASFELSELASSVAPVVESTQSAYAAPHHLPATEVHQHDSPQIYLIHQSFLI